MYVHYWISGLDWTPDYIILEARATVSTSVGQNPRRNVTFVPDQDSPSHDYSALPIPMGGWNMSR